jgi:transcriptional regulator with XRE-family HTH domain
MWYIDYVKQGVYMSKVRDYRVKQGDSIRSLAEKLHMSTTTVQKAERGDKLDDTTWVRLANYFGVPVDELKGEPRVNIEVRSEEVPLVLGFLENHRRNMK